MSSDTSVYLYTDGACKGNPGLGGWGVLLRYQGYERELYGSEKYTTNNRMELVAVIQGLKALKRNCVVQIFTDSQYVVKGATEWMPKWKQNNWGAADKRSIKNKDLWLKLDQLIMRHEVSWHWVKAHAGHPENERVDALANLGCKNRQG